MNDLHQTMIELSPNKVAKLLLWKEAYLAALSSVAGTDAFSVSDEVDRCKKHADSFVVEMEAMVEKLSNEE